MLSRRFLLHTACHQRHRHHHHCSFTTGATATTTTTATATDPSTKLKGYDFYHKVLKSPRYIVAPMVEQSEQAWRILSRKYNAQLCYTPMFHAKLFSDAYSGPRYRETQWSTDPHDRPLIVQFCANDPDTLLEAATQVQHQCDAVDLNLGCPQIIAKRGRYGSYLQDDWETITAMISRLDKELCVPVTAKIRVFPTIAQSVEYAQMIEAAGAQLIVVHGRLREQRGHWTGLADWEKIRAIQQAVRVPVIANGNILYHEDIGRCMEMTGAVGVMSGEGHLYNPTLFVQDQPPMAWSIAQEYLEICRACPTRPNIIKSHLFKLFHAALRLHTDIRDQLTACTTWEHAWNITMAMKERLEADYEREGEEKLYGQVNEKGIRQYGHWRCQPYFRTDLSTLAAPTSAKRTRQHYIKTPVMPVEEQDSPMAVAAA